MSGAGTIHVKGGSEQRALQLSLDNARAFLRGEIVGEPSEGTLAHEIWEHIRSEQQW